MPRRSGCTGARRRRRQRLCPYRCAPGAGQPRRAPRSGGGHQYRLDLRCTLCQRPFRPGDRFDRSRAPRSGCRGRFANRTPYDWGALLPLLLWEQGRGGFSLVTRGASELRTDAALNRILLRGNLLARGDFDRLPIPFRAVATDLRTRKRSRSRAATSPRRSVPRSRYPLSIRRSGSATATSSTAASRPTCRSRRRGPRAHDG